MKKRKPRPVLMKPIPRHSAIAPLVKELRPLLRALALADGGKIIGIVADMLKVTYGVGRHDERSGIKRKQIFRKQLTKMIFG